MSERSLPPHDPETAADLHAELYDRLVKMFEDDGGRTRLAYDGLLWVVKAGIVHESVDPKFEGLELTLRQAFYIPELFRADVSGQGLLLREYEYSRLGGFLLANRMPAEGVYMGQYLAMRDMVNSMNPDDGLTTRQALVISNRHYKRFPLEDRDELLVVQDAADRM